MGLFLFCALLAVVAVIYGFGTAMTVFAGTIGFFILAIVVIFLLVFVGMVIAAALKR